MLYVFFLLNLSLTRALSIDQGIDSAEFESPTYIHGAGNAQLESNSLEAEQVFAPADRATTRSGEQSATPSQLLAHDSPSELVTHESASELVTHDSELPTPDDEELKRTDSLKVPILPPARSSEALIFNNRIERGSVRRT